MSEETTFERARQRVDFRLTYDKCDPRDFEVDMLHGPYVPDAFSENGVQVGEWYQGDGPDYDDPEATEGDWHDHFAAMAVNEAVHEALEWFQVDGRPWLDPHGESERAIYQAVNDLCKKLASLKAAHDSNGTTS